jgi:NADPH-dependent F420 reductase
MGNKEAVHGASTVVLSVPWAAHNQVLEELRPSLAGTVLIDVVVALGTPIDVVWTPPAGSSALEAVRIVGESCSVAAAFQNVAARKLGRIGTPLECDVLVCADNARARDVALRVAGAVGARAFDAGPLANSAVVEGLTAILIGINRRYGSKQAGIAITGVDSDP